MACASSSEWVSFARSSVCTRKDSNFLIIRLSGVATLSRKRKTLLNAFDSVTRIILDNEF